MSPIFVGGILIFIVLFIVSRTITTNAVTKLDHDTKVKMAGVFPKRNPFSTIILLVLVVAYMAFFQMLPFYRVYLTLGYMAAFLVYLGAKFYLNFRKLKVVEAPVEYINSFILGFSLFILGFAIMAGTSLFVMFGN